MAMLGALIAMLERRGALETELKAMGARHAGYGVEERHYETVSRALLCMLEEVLADEFTPAVQEAWTLLYAQVESLMKLGAAEVGPLPRPGRKPAAAP